MTADAAAPSATVVIVSYQPGEWLRPCIESVLPQAEEVIVVDNGSSGSVAASIAASAGAFVVRSPSNLGFSGGVNLGVARARGDVVALLNDDAVAPPNWLTTAGAVLEDESIALVGPKVVLAGRFREVVLPDPARPAPAGDARLLGRQIRSVRSNEMEVLDRLVGDGVYGLETAGTDRWRWTAGPLPFYVPIEEPDADVLVEGEPVPAGPVCRLIDTVGTYLRADGYAGDIGEGAADRGQYDDGADRFGVSFAAVAFRRAVWERLGPLAAPYFAYYEDIDWCWRARLAGLRIRYDPQTTVVHRGSATSGGSAGPGVRVLAESNRTLTLVRNAPRRLAIDHLRWRWRDGPGGGVRSRVCRHLGWAVATRAVAHRRKWTSSPDDVWTEWAGRNVPDRT